MNCNEFVERLQDQLDRRGDIEADGEVRRHVQRCQICAERLNTWRRISGALSVHHEQPSSFGTVDSRVLHRRPVRQRHTPVLRGLVMCALSAAAALLVVFVQPDRGEIRISDDGPRVARSDAAVASDIDPQRWWRGVQHREWIEDTLPAVRSVQRGVAPLGRSLLQAAAILTGGTTRAS